jgi:CBS domain-containing protein
MPCNAAMIKKLITISADKSVEDALEILDTNKIDAIPVVGKDGKLEGVFSTRVLLRNLLPVSVTTGDSLHMDIKVGAAPGVAKRLKKVAPLKVGELMDRKANVVAPETPIWEGVNILVHHGAPILVVERGTGKLQGMITEQSMLDELERLQDKPEQ